MPSRTSTANTLSVFLSLFYIFCFQAHFTRFLTPSMHDQIWAEAPAITHAFWIGPFQPPVSAFTPFLGLLDLALFVTIVRKKTRILVPRTTTRIVNSDIASRPRQGSAGVSCMVQPVRPHPIRRPSRLSTPIAALDCQRSAVVMIVDFLESTKLLTPDSHDELRGCAGALVLRQPDHHAHFQEHDKGGTSWGSSVQIFPPLHAVPSQRLKYISHSSR